jgi:hypothetical protein
MCRIADMPDDPGYDLKMSDGSRHAASASVSRRCDLLVAVARKGALAELRRALDFLGDEQMTRWMTARWKGVETSRSWPGLAASTSFYRQRLR